MANDIRKAENAIASRMAVLNAEIKADRRKRFRNVVAEYALHPELFLSKAAIYRLSGIRYMRTLDEAIEAHTKAARTQRDGLKAKARGAHTICGARDTLAVHEQNALIARYLRRFGDRKRSELTKERKVAWSEGYGMRLIPAESLPSADEAEPIVRSAKGEGISVASPSSETASKTEGM